MHPIITRTKLKHNPNRALQAFHTSHTESKTFKTAFKNPFWLQAMKEKLQALHHSNTWTLVLKLKKNTNIIGTLWLYKIKYKEGCSIDRYKTFIQVRGIDYEETFNPVVKSITIRLVLAVRISKIG